MFDVIVIGAGPAGLSSALNCSKNGLRTLLVEKNQFIGVFLNTSGHTFISDVFEKFKIPKRFIASKINSFYFNSFPGNKSVEVKWKKDVLCTLNHYDFYQYLASQAIKCGCDIQLCTEVIDLIVDNKKVSGVLARRKDGKVFKLNSKIVIDASGSNSKFSSKLGLANLSRKPLGYGIEYDMENVLIENPKRIEYYAGSGVVPISYAWIAPKSKTRAAVGITTVINNPTQEYELFVKHTGKTLSDCFNEFISNHPLASAKLKKAKPLEFRQGFSHLSGMIQKPYYSGFLAVGDSAAQTSPLLGEGIRFSITFGNFAAEVSKKAIENNNVTANFLKEYKVLCEAYSKGSYTLSKETLKIPTDEYWDSVISALNKMVKESKQDLVLKYIKSEIEDLNLF